MRYRALIPFLIVAISVLVPAGLQANVGPAAVSPSVADAGSERSAGPIAQRGKGKKKKRPGCRRFCQQAGGFGDDCDENVEDCDPVEMPDQRLDGTRDRIVSIRATCELDHDCAGAILLTSFRGEFEYGRADLEIPAGQTRNVKVGISKRGLDYLKQNGNDKSAFATVPLVDDDPPVPVSISGKLTLLKP